MTRSYNGKTIQIRNDPPSPEIFLEIDPDWEREAFQTRRENLTSLEDKATLFAKATLWIQDHLIYFNAIPHLRVTWRKNAEPKKTFYVEN